MADWRARNQLRTRPSLFERYARACPLRHRHAGGQSLRRQKAGLFHVLPRDVILEFRQQGYGYGYVFQCCPSSTHVL